MFLEHCLATSDLLRAVLGNVISLHLLGIGEVRGKVKEAELRRIFQEPSNAGEFEMTDLKQLQIGFEKASDLAGEAWTKYIQTGRGGPTSDARLLAWEALSIHGIVFDTTNALAIRGASRILEKIDEELLEGTELGLQREQILYAGGGAGMAVVMPEQAEEAEGRLRRLFAERTLTASCAVASVELRADSDLFRHRVAEVHRRKDRQRALRGFDAEPAVPFFAQRCEVCGRRAVGIHKQRKFRKRLECAPCFERMRIGKGKMKDDNEVDDFQKIADQKEGGAIAVMYADGNKFGKLISEIESPLDYCIFSDRVKDIFAGAVCEAAESLGLALEERDVKAAGFYQLPICAGDDVVAILPGKLAIVFAQAFLTQVEKRIDAELESDEVFRRVAGEKSLGAAAGVAIGKVTYPVRHLVQEAEDLMGRAKTLVYTRHVRSALDFAVVRDGSPRAESEKAKRLEEEPPPLLLSGRPYSLEEMETFVSRLKTFRASGLGKSQLYQLGRFAKAGPAQLRNHVLFQIGREKKWQELLCALEPGTKPGMDADRDFEAIVPHWELGDEKDEKRKKRKHPVLDVADMLAIERYWLTEEAGDEAV